jgi:hypothetical protein
MFFMVPNTIIKNVNGSPFRLMNITMATSQSKDLLSLTAIGKDFDRTLFTVEVPFAKLFKHLVPNGMN